MHSLREAVRKARLTASVPVRHRNWSDGSSAARGESQGASEDYTSESRNSQLQELGDAREGEGL
jgi:hypothetical protein